MRTVHKYVLDGLTTEHRVNTFEGARFLHVDNQYEHITVWAEVNTLARECTRTLHVRGTGTEVPSGCEYVGSALMDGGAFVFHVYAEADR